MTKIRTPRLLLTPCTVEIGRAALYNKDNIKKLIEAEAPESWPQQDLKDFLPKYIRMLETDPGIVGWGIWLIVNVLENRIIGDTGFVGKPDMVGAVEMGYSIVPEYRRLGYAFEAARALVDWAMEKPEVRTIVAECEASNEPSVRILQKLQMNCISKDKNLLKWELKK